jgi:hypothetical protein
VGGVFAFEIKHINGVVHVDGDRWWSDKYDRYGNLVEQGKPLADTRGRAPSRHLNDSAAMLQSFLAKRVGFERVRRIVVMSHANSRLGDMQSITVDYVATADALNIDELFPQVDAPLDGAAVDRIVKAIQKDHEFHLQGPMRRERPVGQPVRS